MFPALTSAVHNPSSIQLGMIAVVSALGGAVNAIAGGGTLLTFPALLGLGVPAVAANATSTVALWPGSFASLWGYRGELVGMRQWALRLAVPSLLGGLIGAGLLLITPDARFRALVPWLVLAADNSFCRAWAVHAVVATTHERKHGTVRVNALHCRLPACCCRSSVLRYTADISAPEQAL